MLGPANPFQTLAVAPLDGRGPNPLLQNHPLMAFHPPMLYLGLRRASPCRSCSRIAALVTGRFGEGWLADTRRATLVAWGFLTSASSSARGGATRCSGGAASGRGTRSRTRRCSRGSPATAFIHSVIVQERRGMLRVWNLSLVIATFCLTILGTFLTRSGVLNSVHAFTRVRHRPVAARVPRRRRGDRHRPHRVARRRAARARAHRLAGVARVGVPRQQPPVRRARVRGAARHRVPAARRGAAGPRSSRSGEPYFDRMTTPIGLALLFLMAVAPALPWRGDERRRACATACSCPRGSAGSTMVVAVLLGARRSGRGPRLRARRVRDRRHRAPVRRSASAAGARALGESRPRSRSVARPRSNPRLYGGLVVHFGVVLIAVALAASSAYATNREVRLRRGRVGDGRRATR